MITPQSCSNRDHSQVKPPFGLSIIYHHFPKFFHLIFQLFLRWDIHIKYVYVGDSFVSHESVWRSWFWLINSCDFIFLSLEGKICWFWFLHSFGVVSKMIILGFSYTVWQCKNREFFYHQKYWCIKFMGESNCFAYVCYCIIEGNVLSSKVLVVVLRNHI